MSLLARAAGALPYVGLLAVNALNGAVKEACDAGVIVVSFDGIVTEPCAWRIAVGRLS